MCTPSRTNGIADCIPRGGRRRRAGQHGLIRPGWSGKSRSRAASTLNHARSARHCHPDAAVAREAAEDAEGPPAYGRWFSKGSPIHRGSFERPPALRVLRRLRMTGLVGAFGRVIPVNCADMRCLVIAALLMIATVALAE